ncbi:Gfo/Idh/MocA family oxidoreductase [Streptomyces calidiresistens]|uniref:Gfo/Idh/MocA family oxidoreductase n=1 Tax=Streptomyces calidiresistens TaxID=1485586 RepID=A0A7W3T6T5_9ACTN|nr:Gfo/Idh/MocA family oxidoreductase [Streptomyces calidiresistens]MBB0232015.1 gfo/Idh/MocA family oxidoreductase [Streptomyces calidiresistens]
MRFGLLGTGPWARTTQGPALIDHPDTELVGVWGRRPEAAGELAGELGTAAFTDVDELLEACDAVTVALPPHVQPELAIRAARAGCHLLLDKPVASEPADARRLVAAVEEAGVASVVFFTLRFAPEPAEWIAEQREVGGWLTARAQWLSAVLGGRESAYSASPWRRERGALWDVGPHILSVLLPVLGDVTDVDRIAAVRGPGDTVNLLLPHVGGAVSTVTLSLTVPPEAAVVEAELRGPAGAVRLPERDRGVAPLAFGRAIGALSEAARGGEPHPCDVRFGARVTEILAVAEERAGKRG